MKKFCKPLFVAIMVMIGIILGGREAVRASLLTDSDAIRITKVNDIEVYNSYEINSIYLDNGVYPYNDTKVFKFTLEQDGFVKILLSADKMQKNTYSSSKNTAQEPVVTATVYRDDKMLYSVIPTITAKGSIDPTKHSTHGETKTKIALDKGTYYVAIKTDKYQGTNSHTHSRGQTDLILYYQPVTSDEEYRPSSVGRENKMTFNESYRGLLTVANPRDYYSFDLKERSLVNIKYMYESVNKFKFVLYGKDRDVRITKQLNGNNVMNTEVLLLEPGKYYISVETLTAGDGGRTRIEVNTTPYPLVLKQVNKNKNSYISVETIEVPKEVRYLKGKLTQDDINNSKWKTAELITDQLKFGVKETGNYSVRVVDDKGNMFINSIKVSACDTTAPEKPKITGYVAGGYEVTGTAEASTIVTVVYSNKRYTCTADAKGNFSAILDAKLNVGAKVEAFATDISGNVGAGSVVVVK